MRQSLLTLFLSLIGMTLFSQYVDNDPLHFPIINNHWIKPGWHLVFQDEFKSNTILHNQWYFASGNVNNTWAYGDVNQAYLDQVENPEYLILNAHYNPEYSGYQNNNQYWHYFDIGYLKTNKDVMLSGPFF